MPNVLEVIMPFCPKCKYEYEENIEFCSDCGTKLVDQLEKEPEVEYDKEVFLTNVADDIQASIIISKLSIYEIPVIKKYREPGGSFMAVFMGNTLLGIDLYVPSKLLDLAKEALEEDTSFDNDETEFDSMMNDFGFDDIDNLDFDETETEKGTNSSLDFTNENKAIPIIESHEEINTQKSHLPSSEDTTNELISHKKKVKRMIAIVIILIIGSFIITDAFSFLQYIFK